MSNIMFKKSPIILAAAMATALSFSPIAVTQAADMEKCYGVSKAGVNDCKTANSSCAGTSKTDAQKDAFLALPKGTCAKIVGGSLILAAK
jgi:uncharacterized membrane protein